MSTFNSLSAEILNYVNRPNDPSTVAAIPGIIEKAQLRIARESKNIGFVKYVRGAFTPGMFVVNKPVRWQRNITFNYGTGENYNTRNQLQLRTYEYCILYWPNPAKTGEPLYYADYGFNGLLIAPTPPNPYPFEMAYLEIPSTLSEQQQTNWLTQYIPDILLHAALLEGMRFLKNTDLIPTWEKSYAEGIQSLNAVDDMRIVDRESNRSAD